MRIRFHHHQWQLLILSALAGLLVSCGGGNSEVLSVRQLHLRDIHLADRDAQMVRGEQLYRLRNAVTLEQRRDRLGHYYTIYWDLPQAVTADMKVVFEYQQAATASKVISVEREIPAGQAKGSTEIQIIGSSYREGGSVLAWRARLMRGSQIVAMKRSYLWR